MPHRIAVHQVDGYPDAAPRKSKALSAVFQVDRGLFPKPPLPAIAISALQIASASPLR